MDRLNLAAVCDINSDAASKYARAFGFKSIYTDYMEMIQKERPDAILAVTPESLTRKIVGEIMPCGIPILMEKPLGNNLSEAHDLVGLAEKHSSRIMLSFNRRFSPMIHPALEWLNEHAKDSPPQMLRASIFRHARHDANFLFATAIHPLDILVSLAGMPYETDIIKTSSRPTGEAVTQLDMRFSNGSLAELVIAPDCGLLSETYEVIGDKYCVRIEYFSSLEIWRNGNLEKQFRLDQTLPTEEKEGALAEMEYFIDCIENSKPFVPGIQDGLNMAILGEKIQKHK